MTRWKSVTPEISPFVRKALKHYKDTAALMETVLWARDQIPRLLPQEMGAYCQELWGRLPDDDTWRRQALRALLTQGLCPQGDWELPQAIAVALLARDAHLRAVAEALVRTMHDDKDMQAWVTYMRDQYDPDPDIDPIDYAARGRYKAVVRAIRRDEPIPPLDEEWEEKFVLWLLNQPDRSMREYGHRRLGMEYAPTPGEAVPRSQKPKRTR